MPEEHTSAAQRITSLFSLESQMSSEDTAAQEDTQQEDQQQAYQEPLEDEYEEEAQPEEEAEDLEEEEEYEEEVDDEEMIARIDEEIASMLKQSTSLRDFISEKYGVDLGKYTSDLQLIHGLVNAAKLLGERAEKVRLYELLEQRFGPEAMQALLEGRMTVAEFEKVERAVAEDAATAEAARRTRFDLSLLEQVEIDPNTRQLYPKPGAPPDAPQRVLKFLEEREKLLNQFAADPEEFLERVVDKVLQQKAKKAQEYWMQMSAQQTQIVDAQRRINEWISQRAKALFVGGDPDAGFTEFGNKVYNEVKRLAQIVRPGTDPVEILNWAYESVVQQSTRSARPQASARPERAPQTKGRTPAAPAPRRKTQEELIKEGLSLADAAFYGD